MLRVAILDDSAIARGVLRTILANGGHNVISESGATSPNVSRLALAAPQLIFLAFGDENAQMLLTLKEIRTELPKAIIFAVSSAFTPDKIRLIAEHGANSFIVKPFNGVAVLSSIRTSILKLVEQQRI